MRYKTFFMDTVPNAGDAERRAEIRDNAGAFFTSFLMTLIAVGFVTCMLFVNRSARMTLGPDESGMLQIWNAAADSAAENTVAEERFSALWRIVGGISPYFVAAVRLFMLLCGFFAFIAGLIDRAG